MKSNYIPLTDEFDINNRDIKAHFKLIRTDPKSGRRAYLRTEAVTGETSFEVIRPKKAYDSKHFFDTYPDSDDFGSYGVYIDGDDFFRDEKIEYYLKNGFDIPYSEHLQDTITYHKM